MQRKPSLLPLLFLVLMVFGCSREPPNVKITRRPADGLTRQAMNPAYLQSLEAWTRKAAQENLNSLYQRNEVPQRDRTGKVQVRSRYLMSEGRKLAVIYLAYTGNPVRVARVSGLKGDSLVTVSCTSPDGAPIEILDPKSDCGRTVNRVFFHRP
jgi:hypothetical protein